jgi:hypothetical protein
VSSILASVRKNRYIRTGQSATNTLFERVLNHAHVVAVDVSSVIVDCCYDDAAHRKPRDISDFMCMSRLLPPFEYMWLEGPLDAENSLAWFVMRFAALSEAEWNSHGLIHPKLCARHKYQPNRVMLFMCLFHRNASEVRGPQVSFQTLLTDDGVFIDTEMTAMVDESETARRGLWRLLDIAFHSLLRMNCANVSLEPTVATRRNNAAKPQRGTVWHEIKVGTPCFSRQREVHHTHIEIRCCWVRGHYADYTKGRGLFGNPRLRAVFWMPEYERGNPELGEVIATYRVMSDQRARVS